MKLISLKLINLTSERLTLIPFTIEICENIIKNDFKVITNMGFIRGISWPDEDVKETLPRIINNLSKVASPTGFESWMIIKNDTQEIIGDIGFKGYKEETQNIDLGYGIIKEERRKGYAEEACTKLISWSFTQEKVKEITACCLVNNFSSINLLKKLKFKDIKIENGFLFWSLKDCFINHPSSLTTKKSPR